MRKCPFCGEEIKFESPYLDYSEKNDVWIFTHYCTMTDQTLDVVVSVYGKTKQEVIDKFDRGVRHE